MSCQNLNVPLDEYGAKEISESFKDHTSLEELHMSNNELGLVGSVALGNFLKHNTSLKTLSISVSVPVT